MDRSHGVSSLENGQFEVMLHRNPDMTDGFGIQNYIINHLIVSSLIINKGPGLTDTDVAEPVIRLIVDSPSGSFLLFLFFY